MCEIVILQISDLVELWAPHIKRLSIRSMVPTDPPPEVNELKEGLSKTAIEYFKKKSKTVYRGMFNYVFIKENYYA